MFLADLMRKFLGGTEANKAARDAPVKELLK